MTTEELGAAVKRSLKRSLEYVRRDLYGNEPTSLLARELASVCKLYLAEHPDDDGEPLTAEWMTAVGGQVLEDGNWYFGDGNRHGCVILHWHDNIDIGDVYRLSFGRYAPNVRVSNRGQLRRLCVALNVPMHDSTSNHERKQA